MGLARHGLQPRHWNLVRLQKARVLQGCARGRAQSTVFPIVQSLEGPGKYRSQLLFPMANLVRHGRLG